MDVPKWLRLVTIGLVLAALAVGYFLLTGKLASNSVTKPSTQVSKSVPTATPFASASITQTPSIVGQNNRVSPAPAFTPTPTPTPVSAFNTIVNRTKGGQETKALPSTGFPAGLIAVFSVSAVIVGWGLRRFPH